MTFDLIVQNGTVIDGTGNDRFKADLGVKHGLIAEIAPKLDAHQAHRTIDASGRFVAPGVIDVHTHYDAQIHWDPYCTGSSWHGTTTVVVGNCGFGFAPCAADPEVRDRYMLMMQNTEQVPYAAMREALGWDWTTFPEYMEHLRRVPKGVNVATYLPMNPLMIYVMGIDAAKSRPATETERARMRQLLNEAMDSGAIGFAFSYLQEHNTHVDFDGSVMPSDGMAIEEAYNLAQVLRERGDGMIHALVEVPGAVNHREITAKLARISGRPVLHTSSRRSTPSTRIATCWRFWMTAPTRALRCTASPSRTAHGRSSTPSTTAVGTSIPSCVSSRAAVMPKTRCARRPTPTFEGACGRTTIPPS